MRNHSSKLTGRIIAVLFIVTTIIFTCTACFGGDTEKTKEITGEQDLKGAKIGVQLGTVGDTYVSDYKKDGATVVQYNKGADAVQALKKGKVDCVVIDQQPAKAFVEENQDLKILEEPLTTEEYAICIAKGKEDFLNKVNSALEKLERTVL